MVTIDTRARHAPNLLLMSLIVDIRPNPLCKSELQASRVSIPFERIVRGTLQVISLSDGRIDRIVLSDMMIMCSPGSKHSYETNFDGF